MKKIKKLNTFFNTLEAIFSMALIVIFIYSSKIGGKLTAIIMFSLLIGIVAMEILKGINKENKKDVEETA